MLCSAELPAMADLATRVAAGLAGAWAVVWFFQSIIRVGVLNQRYQDPLAFWVGRFVLILFQVRARGATRGKQNEIFTWYWPSAFISIIVSWFLLVTIGFALMTWALGAEATFLEAFIASGSALSTLGFSTPGHVAGQLLAIIEGAIGLFLIVYLFTFLPGFMDLIHVRGERVSWIYARSGTNPSGTDLLLWFNKNGLADGLPAVWEDWESFFRNLSQARSFLPILSIIRPLDASTSWVCAFGAFLDALAISSSCLKGPKDAARICFDCGVRTIQNVHTSLRGSAIHPKKTPELMHVARTRFESSFAALQAAGFDMEPDIEKAWQAFLECHMQYEQQIAWLAALLNDPTPAWPGSDAKKTA